MAKIVMVLLVQLRSERCSFASIAMQCGASPDRGRHLDSDSAPANLRTSEERQGSHKGTRTEFWIWN